MVRPEIEHLAFVLLADREGVIDGMKHVLVGNPVPAGGPVDLHVPNIVSRNASGVTGEQRRVVWPSIWRPGAVRSVNVAAPLRAFGRVMWHSDQNRSAATRRKCRSAGEGPYEDFDGEPEVRLDAVDVLSVHAAKGLEWPVVFVPSVTGGRFPSPRAGQATPSLVPSRLYDEARYAGGDADERRLFYVAVARARDWLSVSGHERVTKQRVGASPY